MPPCTFNFVFLIASSKTLALDALLGDRAALDVRRRPEELCVDPCVLVRHRGNLAIQMQIGQGVRVLSRSRWLSGERCCVPRRWLGSIPVFVQVVPNDFRLTTEKQRRRASHLARAAIRWCSDKTLSPPPMSQMFKRVWKCHHHASEDALKEQVYDTGLLLMTTCVQSWLHMLGM